MNALKTLSQRFISDQSGATAIEYGFIAGLISVTIIAIVGVAGGHIAAMFADVAARIAAAVTAMSS